MLSLITAIALAAGPVPAAATTQVDRDAAFLKDLAQTRSWSLGQPRAVSLTPDGTTVLFLRSPARSPMMRLYAMDVATGQVRELVTPEQVLGGAEEKLSAEEKARRERMRVTLRGFTSYALSEDGRTVLVQLSGKAYVMPVAGGPVKEVAGPDAKGNAVLDPKLSPDGARVAFVRSGELWVAPVAGGPARQLTRGAAGLVTHAQAEFVAQEELDRHSGFFWSPDSRSLVYEEADASGVEQLGVADGANPFGSAGSTPYPRPGRQNVKVSFGIVSAGGGPTRWISWDRKAYEYVSGVAWQRGAPLTLTLLSRDQRDLSLVQVDLRTGATRELLHERDEDWIEPDRDYAWLSDGSGFLWSTERRGDWQLELHRADGTLSREVTAVDFGFGRLLHVDERGRTAVVARAAEPIEQELWRVPLDGGEPKPVAQGPDFLMATFARDSEAHVLARMPRSGSASQEVFRADGTSAGPLPSVAEPPPFDVRVELQKVGPAPGLWTAIVRPHDFDPAKKYPVILSVYGGPNARTVSPAGARYVSDQWMADHGYLVVHVDVRGTPGRGRAWSRLSKNEFATVPLEDEVAGLQSLAGREPALDLGRVGVIGHSFGGYMAALAVMRRPDVFRAGVAGAPVVDWRNYDTAYTERYLGVPPPAGASDVYERNGLVTYAKELRRPLLVIHGTADDNVHFSESLLLMDALFRAGTSEWASLLPLSGQTHLFYEPAVMERYWRRVFGFFEANLGRGP